VATICDQGTSNVGAITILNNETRQFHLKNKTQYYSEFYEVELENKERFVKLDIKFIKKNFTT